MDSDNFSVVLHQSKDDAAAYNMKIQSEVLPLSSQVSIINLLRTFASKKFIVSHRRRCRVEVVHLTLLAGSLALESRPATFHRFDVVTQWKKRWIFTSKQPADGKIQQPSIENVRIVSFDSPLRKYNEHRPTFCRFSNLFLARSASRWRISNLFTFSRIVSRTHYTLNSTSYN